MVWELLRRSSRHTGRDESFGQRDIHVRHAIRAGSSSDGRDSASKWAPLRGGRDVARDEIKS